VLLAPTPTNRLALASTALKAEPFPYPTATKTSMRLKPEFRRTANYQMVAGALAIKLGHLSEAEQHYAEALKLQPDTRSHGCRSPWCSSSPKDPKVIADSRINFGVAHTDGKLGILPLRSLVAESAAAQ